MNTDIKNPEDYAFCVLATMPRSGTWYTAYLFHVLDKLMSDSEHDGAEWVPMTFNVLESLKIVKLQGHMICPGFLENPAIGKDDWTLLKFHTHSYNNAYKYVGMNQNIFNLLHNPKLKILYLYRNPLDQCLSYYRHAQAHAEAQIALGTKDVSARDYAFSVGFQSYAKQFLTYMRSLQACPHQVRLYSYESLVKQPVQSFQHMIEFIEGSVTPEKPQIEYAAQLCGIDQMKTYERLRGKSLGSDQRDLGASHIKDGSIGQWREYLDEDAFAAAAAYFDNLGINLSDFQLDA